MSEPASRSERDRCPVEAPLTPASRCRILGGIPTPSAIRRSISAAPNHRNCRKHGRGRVPTTPAAHHPTARSHRPLPVSLPWPPPWAMPRDVKRGDCSRRPSWLGLGCPKKRYVPAEMLLPTGTNLGGGSAPRSLSHADIRRRAGCQLPDAILHGKRSFRPHSRAVQRLTPSGF
jgi:hypothetical protein